MTRVGISIVVVCTVLMDALCRESPLYGSDRGGKWGAILHIHVAFVALGRGTFVLILWIDILVSVHIQLL